MSALNLASKKVSAKQTGDQAECMLSLLDRQKQRENKKFNKAVQAERQKEKVQQKKANISDITKLRKQRQKQVSAYQKTGC